MAARKANSIAEYAAKRRGEEQRPFGLPRRRSNLHRTPQSGVDRYAQGLHPKRGFIGGKANRSDRRSGAQPYTPPEPSPYAGLCLLSPGGESRSPGGEIPLPRRGGEIPPPLPSFLTVEGTGLLTSDRGFSRWSGRQGNQCWYDRSLPAG